MATDIENTSTSNGTPSRRKQIDILDLVGKNGPWQRRIFLVALFISIPSATQNLSMSFLAPDIDYWCARPPGASNLSVEQWKRIAIPPEDSHCSRYKTVNLTYPVHDIAKNSSDNDTIQCDAWEYNTTFYTSTVLSEWNLVCDREWLVSLSKSVFVAGLFVTGTVSGYLGDRFGRRLIISIFSFISVCFGIICAFSISFIMFIIARFFLAIGIGGIYFTSFVLLIEVISPELRSVYGLAVQFGWSLGFVSLPAIAWLLKDWFWIQITLTAPCFILLAVWWMIPESPRWLLSQGRVDEARSVLNKAARLNGVKFSDTDEMLEKISREVLKSGGNNANVLDLLRTPGLWQITLNLYFAWFVNAFVYYGLSYNTNELAGNPFINFALSGAVEFPASFLSIFAIRLLGRRNSTTGSMILAGLACLLSYLLPQDPWWLSVMVSMIGKFFITCSFAILFVFTTELFPTVLRNIGMGSGSICARFGSVLAPFVRELGTATYPVVPQIIFGILSATSGALVLFLPETNNCTVPDTIKEAADFSKRRCKKLKHTSANNGIVNPSYDATDDIQENRKTQAVLWLQLNQKKMEKCKNIIK